MKKILFLIAVFGMLQTVSAQKKKPSSQKQNTTKTVTYSSSPNNEYKSTATVIHSTSQKTESNKNLESQFYTKGDLQLNAGVGLLSVGLPLQAGLDYFVTDDISVGVEGSYERLNESFFEEKYQSTVIGIGANGNYHFNRILKIPSKWDLYAGVSVSYFIWSFDQDYLGDNSNGIGFAGQIGGRYFFTNSFGANVELGGGSSTSGVKIGVTYKF